MDTVAKFWRVWLGMTMAAVMAWAQEPPRSEYQVKAAFLYNFAKFVDWPAGSFPTAETPITIGLIGGNPFGPSLEDSVQNKTIGGHGLVVRTVKSLAELKNCHIVFIHANEKKRLREILDSLRNASVLTVSDMDRFTENGGMIDLVMEDKKVRFDIDNAAARRAGLKISPRLLKLARNRPAPE